MSNHEESLLGNINFIDGAVLQLMWDHDKKTHSGLHDNYYKSGHKTVHTGRTQSMKIDDRKSNRSIDANRCMLVNWHRLVSANR